MESCETCGDDLRRYCSQGHVSGAGELFCDTCGELLPFSADQHAMTPAAPLAMDYSSGSFTDFIAGSAEDPGARYGSWPAVAALDMPVAPADFVPEPETAETGDYAEAEQPEPKAEPEPIPEFEALAEQALAEPEAPPEP